MLRRFVLLIFLVLEVSRPQSQQHDPAPAYLDNYRKAEALYNSDEADERTDSIALQLYSATIRLLQEKPLDDTALFNSYLHASILQTGAGNDLQSLRLLQRSIELNKTSGAIPDSASFLPWIFAGSNYYSLYNADSALACYREAERIYQQHRGIHEAERLFNKMGVLYYEAGDYRKSIPQFERALSLVDSSGAGAAYFLVNYKNNIASAYRKLQEYDRALEIYQSLLPLNLYKDELRHNIGVTYLEHGKPQEAIQWLEQVGYRNATIFNDLAKSYIQAGKADRATYFLNQAYKTYAPNLVQDRPDHANSLKTSGDLNSLKGDYTAAIRFYHHAILEIYPVFTDSLVTSNPARFNGTYNFYFLFNALTSKAESFSKLYKRSKRLADLQHSFSTYESAITLASHMERLYGTDESRLFVKRRAEPVYEDAVETGLELVSADTNSSISRRLFAIIENTKASVLQADVYNLALNNVKGMPVKLLAEERALKSNLASVQLRLNQANDSTATNRLKAEVQKLSIDLTHVQEQLDQDPAYQSLRFGNRRPEAAELATQLSGDEMILSYFLTTKHLVCFYISAKSNGYIKLAISGGFTDTIRQLRSQLVAPDGGNMNLFKSFSGYLFNKLLQPVEDTLRLPAHLLIIPHREISYIPFEMLTNGDHQPMVHSHAISYQYSTNFIEKTLRNTSVYRVLSVAPFASPAESSMLPPLPASIREVDDLPGKHLIDSTATRVAFIDAVKEFPVLHLATHARADDSIPANSFIHFFGNDPETSRLYEPGIYQLNLSGTSLAILSACETGSGKLENSEGIISLSRAFTYAGCRSVITSLWKANDEATAFISRRLHHYLQKGVAKDEALRRAKVDYLESNDIDTRLKKPSYWATLVLTGDSAPIASSSNGWLIGAALLAAITFFTWWRFSKRLKK